mgnify:CR=1 FL=1
MNGVNVDLSKTKFTQKELEDSTNLYNLKKCTPKEVEICELIKKGFSRAEIAKFFCDIPQRIASSHLVISRSGASTVAELTTIGRPAIFVPYPGAIDDHQAANAHALDEVGGGWLIPDEVFTADSLAQRLRTLLEMPKILQSAAEAARRAGCVEAGKTLADLVLDLMSANFDQPKSGGAT